MAKKSKKDGKKSKKDIKKSKKVKKIVKIPAKSGAKARVSRDGKVEVILPVDRSRGAYKPRKTEDQKIEERLQQLRSQERRQYSRDVLAPENVSGSYRRGGSIYRSDITVPSGGFTGIVSSKDDKKLKEVNEKLDKLLAKEKLAKNEQSKQTARTPTAPAPITEVATRRRATTQTPLTGQSVRQEQSPSIVADIGSGISAVATAGAGLVSAGVSGVLQSAEQQLQSGRERKIEADNKKIREAEEKREADRKKAITDSTQRRLKRIDERISGESGVVDSIMGGETDKQITLRADPNIAKEKREIDRRQKALQDEKNRKDKEETYKLQEKLDRERRLVKEKESKEQALKVRKAINSLEKDENIDDLFSELESAPKKDNVELVVEEIDSDDDFKSVDGFSEPPTPPPRKVKPELPPRDEAPELPPRDDDYEKLRQQVLKDQELARELLREQTRNKDRKIKEEQERINKLSKLNETFIAHRNREDRNQRRRQQRREDKEREEKSKAVVDEIFDRAILKQSQEEEERDNPPRSKRGRKAGKVSQASLEALVEAGATRGEVEENDIRLQNIEVIIRGLFTGFGITLPREYRTASKKIRTEIRRNSVRKLRDRGFKADQLLEFTRLLDELNEEIRLRNEFGNKYQRRRGVVKQEVDRINEIEED